MKKENDYPTKNPLNPLSILFGLFLKHLRGRLAISSADEFAKHIGLTKTYYRTIESGINNLSALHGLKIVQCINELNVEGARKGFEEITLYLSINGYLESLVRNDESAIPINKKYEFHTQELLNELDKSWISIILRKFLKIDIFSFQDPATAQQKMLDDAAEIMLFNFFVRGKGMLLDDDDSVSNISYSYFRITLETLPSMYIPLSIIHTKYIAHLPSYHTLDSIMQWISNNIKDFRSWCWIIKSESSQWTKNAEGYAFEFLLYEEIVKLDVESSLVFITDYGMPIIFHHKRHESSWRNMSLCEIAEAHIPLEFLS